MLPFFWGGGELLPLKYPRYNPACQTIIYFVVYE